MRRLNNRVEQDPDIKLFEGVNMVPSRIEQIEVVQSALQNRYKVSATTSGIHINAFVFGHASTHVCPLTVPVEWRLRSVESWNLWAQASQHADAYRPRPKPADLLVQHLSTKILSTSSHPPSTLSDSEYLDLVDAIAHSWGWGSIGQRGNRVLMRKRVQNGQPVYGFIQTVDHGGDTLRDAVIRQVQHMNFHPITPLHYEPLTYGFWAGAMAFAGRLLRLARGR